MNLLAFVWKRNLLLSYMFFLPFGQFNVSLLSKSINLFLKKENKNKKVLLPPNFE